MRISKATLAILAVSFTAAGCDDGITEAGVDDQELTTEEEIEVIEFLTDQAFNSGDSEVNLQLSSSPSDIPGIYADQTEFSRTFAHERECPRGGSIAVDGTLSGVFDRDTHSATATLDAFKVFNDCARPLRDMVVILSVDRASDLYDGIDIDGQWAKQQGDHVGPQTWSMHGGFLWAVGDRSGSCEVHVDVVVDPTAGERRVTGSFCGKEVDRTTTWSRDG